MFDLLGKRQACKAAQCSQAAIAVDNPSALQLCSGYTQKNNHNNS